jgi:general secretion pathway protein D
MKLRTLSSRALLASCVLAASIATAGAPTITLNFKDTEIREVATSIGEITGRNFIFDPRVKGKVTVVSAKPIPLDSVYSVFLSVLQVNGFAAVPSGAMVKIVPTVDARTVAGRMPDSKGAPGDEIVTQVVELRNVSATQMMGALRPLVAQYGHITPVGGANALIIADTQSNVNRLTQVIARVDEVSEGSVEFVALQHASAGDIVRVMTSLTQGGPKEAGATPPTVVADERSNSVLISGTAGDRLRLKTLVAHLDTPREDDGNAQVIYLRYADAESLAKILQGYATTGGGGARSGYGAASAAAGAGGTQVATVGAGPMLEGVTIMADPATNALIVNAVPRQMQALRAIVDKLDIRRAQVHVEAIIVEMTADKAAELGVTWAVDASSKGTAGLTNFSRVGPGLIQLGGAAAGGAQSVNIIPDGITLGVGRVQEGGVSFAAIIRALAGDGRTNILSTPSLVTLDNVEAQIKVGQEVPFLTGQYSNTGGGSTPTNPFQTIERKEVGVMLKIKPKINEGSAVYLDISQEVSSLSTSAVSTVDAVTNKRTISTSVLANDREIIVLGGLMDDNLQESEQRVPILGSIPGIGSLFRSRKTTKIKQTLVVFLRPTILHTAEDAARFSNSKYDTLREMQIERNKRDVPLMPNEKRPVVPELAPPEAAAPAEAPATTPPAGGTR